ncbi:MAG: hypothetical protein LBJ24_01655 [Treponema sp.]|jgi:hypothetical protein|nr:hypothetical protein [Treponema sp.]
MKKKPELLNFASLARRAGVGPAAISQFMRKQASQGSPIPTVPGKHRRERLVDLNHPAIQGYLKNQTAQPGNRGGGKPPTQAAIEKLRAQTEKTELAADALRAKYIDRSFALEYLNELLETEEWVLAGMVDRILKKISEEFSPTTDRQMAEVRRILEQPCVDAVEMSRREVEKFRRETSAPDYPELTAPARKGKKHVKDDHLSRR